MPEYISVKALLDKALGTEAYFHIKSIVSGLTSPKAILELPEMPESCLNCPCIAIDAWGKPKCRIIHSNNGLADAFSSGRRPDCPLKLVEKGDSRAL